MARLHSPLGSVWGCWKGSSIITLKVCGVMNSAFEFYIKVALTCSFPSSPSVSHRLSTLSRWNLNPENRRLKLQLQPVIKGDNTDRSHQSPLAQNSYTDRAWQQNTHNIEFEQWSLGAIGLDGKGLDSAQKVQFNSTILEGKKWSVSGINLQIHQQTWVHVGELQRHTHTHTKMWAFWEFKLTVF